MEQFLDKYIGPGSTTAGTQASGTQPAAGTQ
jgi:hypothetical protein